MGKFNEIFEYPVTRPIPYGKAFHICFALFQVVILAIFAVWGAATAGYNTVTISSPNYNLTEVLWYSRFIPAPLQNRFKADGLCSGATSFTPGASFSTQNDLFSYLIGSYYNEPGSTTRPSDVIEYRGTSMDTCTPVDIMINVDALRNTVDASALVICYAPWPVVSSNRYSYASSPVKSALFPGVRSSLSITTWTTVNSTGSLMFRALDFLAADLLGTLKLLRTQTSGAGPSEYSVVLSAGVICPIAFIGTPSCPTGVANMGIQFSPDSAINTYANGSVTRFDRDTENRDLAVPARNLATAIHAATVYDLGSTINVTNNIYTRLSTLNQLIQTTNTNATTAGVNGSALTGAAAFAADAAFPLPATGPVVIRATYLCRVKQLKDVAGFIFAVAGLATSLFTTFFAVATIIIVMILRARRDDLMYCQGHAQAAQQQCPTVAPYDPKVTSGQMAVYSPVPTLPSQQSTQYVPQIYNRVQGYQTGYS